MTYYITQRGSLYELKQTRFKHYVTGGSEHPWDVCAVGRNVEEILDMYDKYLSGGIEGHRAP
jgi:hypothetical protein